MKPVLIKKLLQSLGQDPNSEEKLKDAFFAFKVRNGEEEDESNSNFDTWGQEDVEIGGGEVFDRGNKYVPNCQYNSKNAIFAWARFSTTGGAIKDIVTKLGMIETLNNKTFSRYERSATYFNMYINHLPRPLE